MAPPTASPARQPLVAALVGGAVGFLGGVMQVGGSGFRLPFLLLLFRYSARQAVPINLTVSLLTVTVSLAMVVFRGARLPDHVVPVVVTMIIGGVLGSYAGASWVARHVPERRLRLIIRGLLVVLGSVLVAQGAIGELPRGLPVPLTPALVLAFTFGGLFGLLRSLLGIAGGEVVWPTLVILFGLDGAAAGMAALMINVPTVGVGVARYAYDGLIGTRDDWKRVVLPMAVASVACAVIGAMLAPSVPGALVKVVMGGLLVITSLITMR